jgi:hypothetical protein
MTDNKHEHEQQTGCVKLDMTFCEFINTHSLGERNSEKKTIIMEEWNAYFFAARSLEERNLKMEFKS